MRTANLKIRALTCPHCAEEVEKALVAQRGVRSAAARTGSPGGAEVQYDETHITLEHLVAVLRGQGYDAEIGGHSAGGAP